MPIEIVDLSAGDPATIDEVLRTVVVDHRPGPGARTFVADDHTFFLAAQDGQRPVGLSWGVHVGTPTGRRMTYLHQLDVIESHRRRGIASELVAAAMTLARTAGSERFWLSTGGHNLAAQALYDRLGGDRKVDGDVNYWWVLN